MLYGGKFGFNYDYFEFYQEVCRLSYSSKKLKIEIP